jgi:hypothetical protein
MIHLLWLAMCSGGIDVLTTLLWCGVVCQRGHECGRIYLFCQVLAEEGCNNTIQCHFNLYCALHNSLLQCLAGWLSMYKQESTFSNNAHWYLSVYGQPTCKALYVKHSTASACFASWQSWKLITEQNIGHSLQQCMLLSFQLCIRTTNFAKHRMLQNQVKCDSIVQVYSRGLSVIRFQICTQTTNFQSAVFTNSWII